MRQDCYVVEDNYAKRPPQRRPAKNKQDNKNAYATGQHSSAEHALQDNSSNAYTVGHDTAQQCNTEHGHSAKNARTENAHAGNACTGNANTENAHSANERIGQGAFSGTADNTVNPAKKNAPRQTQSNAYNGKLDREKLEYAAACAQELKQRKAWRDDPAQWCRERVLIEPSWRVLAAQSLQMTLEEFEKRHGGELEDKFVEILESVRDNENTLVQSGHQIGKTLAASCAVLWFLDVYRPSRAITTSATWTDVETKLWGTIRTLYRKNGQWFNIDALETALKITDEHYALGLSPKEVEPFQGHNAKHVLVVFDEASSIAQKFFDAASAEATRTLAIGNPLLAEGAFYKSARSPEWHTIKVSCLAHPNVVFGREVIAGGPRKSWVESRKKAWGERGPLYLSRVLGEFPEESEDTLFPLSTIRTCFELYDKIRDLPAAESGGDNVLGLDVARQGGDRTIGYGSDWVQYEGRLIKRVRKVVDFAYTDHHKTRIEVAAKWKLACYHHANVDAGGEGSGLADELPKMGEGFSVNRILFGSNAQNDDYFNTRAEMYWQLSTAMKSGNYAVERDDELEEELSVTGGMRDYKEKMVAHKKKLTFWLPPKEEIKLRLLRSPDKADGLALENYKGRSCGMFDLWREEAEKQDRIKAGGIAQDVQAAQPVTHTPEAGSEQEIAAAQKENVFRFTPRSVVKRGVVYEERKCSECDFNVATYASLWKCNNCGASGPLVVYNATNQ